MSVYLIPIQTAILVFPILAALITIPYMIIQYRRYGSILLVRSAIVYSFIFYLLCAYFLVILPLPPIEEVANYTTPTMQLTPFKSYMDLSLTSSLVLSDPSTYWAAFNEPSLFLIIFNILLTVPFGLYLRYYFQCSWKRTLLLGFLLTLSFESLQLSALFGIYPRPYRLFEVDDLINNTLGAMLGYLITPLLVHFLPSREHMDARSMDKGRQVSPLRRISAFFIDLGIIVVLTLIIITIFVITNIVSLSNLSYQALLIYAVIAMICTLMLSIIAKGKTPGKALVNIRLVGEHDQLLKWYQHLLHYIVLYLLILPAPYVIFITLIHYLDVGEYITPSLFIISIGIVFYIFSLFQNIRSLFVKESYPWYDRIWKLHHISTIPISQTEEIITEEQIEDGEVDKKA